MDGDDPTSLSPNYFISMINYLLFFRIPTEEQKPSYYKNEQFLKTLKSLRFYQGINQSVLLVFIGFLILNWVF